MAIPGVYTSVRFFFAFFAMFTSWAGLARPPEGRLPVIERTYIENGPDL